MQSGHLVLICHIRPADLLYFGVEGLNEKKIIQVSSVVSRVDELTPVIYEQAVIEDEFTLPSSS